MKINKVIICNAFSLNMLPVDRFGSISSNISINELSEESVKAFLASWPVVSAIGHNDTATILSRILDRDIEMNRVNVILDKHDLLIVCQYAGPRMPEGTTMLPEGATFKFMSVSLLLSREEEDEE